jgi:hypothetical protein
MLDLDNQLRELIDNGASPITAEEIFASREPMTSQSNQRFHRNHSRRSRAVLVSGLALAIVAGAIVGLVAIPGPSSFTSGRASAASFLNATATIAQHQKPLVPGPNQYLYVANAVSLTNGETVAPSPKMFFFYADELVQTWTAPGLAGHQTWTTVGRPEFVSAADHAIWVIDGSKPLQSGSSSGHSSPYYDVVNLPTKPSAMLAFFKSQNYLNRADVGRNADWEFSSALAFLQNGASASQRAALLRFLATIPGVRLMGSGTSMVTHERGTLIGLPADLPGLTNEAIFNAATSKLIETRTVITAPNKLPAFYRTPPERHYFAGEVQSYSDSLSIGLSGSSTRPSNSLRLPPAWPSGSTREPLAVVLNPKTGRIVKIASD